MVNQMDIEYTHTEVYNKKLERIKLTYLLLGAK
jgi:hypothetical protein